MLVGLSGFAAGMIASLACLGFLVRKLKGSDFIFSNGASPEIYKDVEVLEHAPRPHGLYVRFRNRGAKPIEAAYFKVRGYKDGKLWAEFEGNSYSETQPGQEQETILTLQDNRDRSKTFDLSECRVEVKFLYGFVLAKKAT